MTYAQRIFKEDFGIEFILLVVCNIVRQLDFNYGKLRPKFRETPKKQRRNLKKNIDFARITIHDIVIALDESTIKQE